MPKLVLIDGHALAYRAYFALESANLKTHTGELTGAVYGFTSMLLNVWRDEQPDYIAVTFDVGKTFRNEMYADYKATRAKMPEELVSQLERIQQVVQAFNLPVITAEGFEADDVLGTLATRASAEGLQTIIVTGDTDIFQLIGPNVRVLTSQRKWSDTLVYDEAAIRERYGLAPSQLIDYKALVGDTSDNVPGVKGIGDKTATQLLQQYATLEAIYDHLAEITPRRAQAALEAGRDSAILSKKLVAIKTDVPLDITWEQCRAAGFDRDKVLTLFQQLEFRSLADRLPAGGIFTEGASQQMDMFGQLRGARSRKQEAGGTEQGERETRRQGDRERVTITHVVADAAGLRALVARLSKAELISLDVETTGTDPMQARLVGISVAVEAGEGYYVPVGHAASVLQSDESQLPLVVVLDALKPILANESIAKVGHNIKYDMTVLTRYGAPVAGVRFDTLIAEWLINPDSHSLSLKPLAWERLGVEMTPLEALVGKGKSQITLDRVAIADVAAYAAADADMPLRLQPHLASGLQEKNLTQLFQQVEVPLISVLKDMEMAGVLLDLDFLRRMAGELDQRLVELQKQIIALAGRDFNINSTQQLTDVLFGKLQLKAPGMRKTATGRISMAQDVLESMKGQHPIIEQILEHRQLSKLKSTYVDALPALVNPDTGRVHTSYNQTGTVTGRLSSSDPNLQNIPIRTDLGRQVRRAFIAAPGNVFVAADYSQVELRILAHICGDPGLQEAFARGEDIHASTAAAIYGVPIEKVDHEQRRIAKSINFGLAYGQGAFGLAQSANISQSEAQKFIDAYFKRFANVRAYIDQTKRQAAAVGYLETILGRRRYFPLLQSKDQDQRTQIARRAAEREAINMPIQGSAADIIKVAMIKLHQRLGAHPAVKMILQVHDELVLEAPQDQADKICAIVREEMENAYSLSVPLKVDVKAGQNWDEAK
jgi:DNA polymerase-1